ncbi:hypothetical protein JK191_08435 [Gluconobacter sphaericus]|uniref:hypothetical protein n=1 Tax=Gluconobacter sphaericus TaxID=574987 RepID=UPI0019236295|nr:hypothetical protein [Gluconobacter sphaericus]MBS1097601.1 hypothetical protein [Gluconobacter sphaericus]QQX90801.1 hypothetical protein IGS75_11685 [Gluconobacter sphaericus]
MKKILALVLGAGLTLSLTACDGPYDDRRGGGHHHHGGGGRGYGQGGMGGQGMGGQGMGGGQGGW